MPEEKKRLSTGVKITASLVGITIAASILWPDGQEDAPAPSPPTPPSFSTVVKDPNPSPQNQAMPTESIYRQSVMVDDAQYNAVGRILLNNQNSCTGTIITTDNYNLIEPGILVNTTGHCVLDEEYNLENNLSFVANYVGANGQEQHLILTNPEIWVDQDYIDYARQGKLYSTFDSGLLFFAQADLPVEIQPVSAFVAEFPSPEFIQEFFNISVTAAGYSFDMRGLSQHEGCQILDTSQSVFETNCVVKKGGSGSPLFIRSATGDFRLMGTASGADGEFQDDGRFTDYAILNQYSFNRSWPEFFQR